MAKVDLKKELKEFYAPKPGKIAEVDVPAMNFLMVDGKGDPNNSKEYEEAIQALYTLSYTIKFDLKKSGGPDYGVMPLEGLWWADDMKDFDPEKGNRNNWKWTAMIMQPDFVTKDIVKRCTEVAAKKKPLPALSKVRFEKFAEGRSVQMMHIGPYSAEGPNIQKLHDYIASIGGKLTGKHHEIYFSDPRRVAPEKMKTGIRQPYSM